MVEKDTAKAPANKAVAETPVPEAEGAGPARAAEPRFVESAAVMSTTPVRSAEELDKIAAENAERRTAVAAGTGAYAVDEKSVEALAEQTNALTGPSAGLVRPPGVPVRDPGAGFTRMGQDIAAIGQTSKLMPLQHVAPQDETYPDAVVNQPLGSEAGFVDPGTGVRTYQPKTKDHLLGAGVEAQALDDGTKVAKTSDAK